MTPSRARGEELPAHCVNRMPMRVRFFETDLMGIVHHASYLTYVEAGRVEYLRARGADYRDLARSGFHMPVVEASLAYKRPAYFDDELVVETRLAALTRTNHDDRVRQLDQRGTLDRSGWNLFVDRRVAEVAQLGPVDRARLRGRFTTLVGHQIRPARRRGGTDLERGEVDTTGAVA